MERTAMAVVSAVAFRIYRVRSLASQSVPYLRKTAPVAISIFLFIGAAAFALANSDLNAVATSIARLSRLPITAAFVLMLAGAMLASLRLKLIADDLGYPLSFRDSVSALSLGHLGGILFFQIAGQLLARSALLSRRHIPVSATIVVTGYERLTALVVSLVFAVAAAVYLYGKISIDTASGGILIFKVFLGLATATTAGAIFCWGRLVVDNLPRPSRRMLFNLVRSIILSLAIQFMTMTAYVVLLKSLVPEIPVFSLAAGAALVMFAASLPISFAGWGMRELSAIVALGTIGVSADASFAVAAMIGLISLSVVGLMAVTAIGNFHLSTPIYSGAQPLPIDFGSLLKYGLPLAAATAVFFQVFVPVNQGAINVNLADPAVILGGSLFVVHNFGRGWPRWRVPHFELYVALATLLIATALLHGLASFGWASWAFTNRFLGWFVLLAYGATGALIIQHAGREGLDLLLRTFVTVAVSIVVLELLSLFFYEAGAVFLRSLVDLPFLGFSANRNAFAFQVLLAACAVLAASRQSSTLLLSIIFAGLWFCGSRSVFIALSVVMIVAAYVGHLQMRTALASILLAVAIVLLVLVVPQLVQYVVGTQSSATAKGLLHQIISPGSGYAEHIKSMLGGWTMFLGHPIFGAGLGAFMHQEMQTGTPLVIHSTPLWLLAEMGLVGLLVMATPIVRIFWSEIGRGRKNDMAGVTLVLIITAFAVVSNVHDMMYQRAFWLLLGAGLAYVPAALSENSAIAS